MISANSYIPMSSDDIRHFLSEMDRKCKGLFLDIEKQRISKQNSTYNALLKKNGGVNPLFRR